EMEHRRHLAETFRKGLLLTLAQSPGAFSATSVLDTRDALERGVELVISPRLADDEAGNRRASAHALVRLGRHDDRFVYAPLVVKNSEVVEASATRQLLSTDLAHLSPAQAVVRAGVCVRSTLSLTRSGIGLAHTTRVLQALGFGDELARVALVDRHRHVWWLDLAGPGFSRFNLTTYDALYEERRTLLDAHDAWSDSGREYPTTPYWHRECEDCTFRDHCRDELEARDDVSLTHYSNFEQQRLLHEFGIDTRRELASLDPRLARLARRTASDSSSREAVLGLAIERLEDLIYRARVHVTGTLLRIVESDAMGCPSADVEVDVDMESYGEHTYLWGASVRLAPGVTDLAPGYHSFVEWEELTQASEARIFSEFWAWFSALREQCRLRGLSFAAYCFWAQAEDGAMNRAVDPPLATGPTRTHLENFRSINPPEWIDLHHSAKSQIQTDGPLGLKVLARAAGFQWRDEHPSGEASMRWFEAARGGDDVDAWRQRILEYNEDDCRATQALRDWLNGPARLLAHRDQIGSA
ncbi:MAG: TM0106 family RecB-like putative nuclease, partial [Acidimicrobiaceae bacterium]|nr:TM0106 family RecB-like putative nuclease [Acidimicrobiaceae bacterium]